MSKDLKDIFGELEKEIELENINEYDDLINTLLNQTATDSSNNQMSQNQRIEKIIDILSERDLD